jgi:hypothetical protein
MTTYYITFHLTSIYEKSFLLQLKKFSKSIYDDKYVKNKKDETSQSKEDVDISQIYIR